MLREAFEVDEAWHRVGREVEFVGHYPGVADGTRARITQVTLQEYGWAVVVVAQVKERPCLWAFSKDEAARYLRDVKETRVRDGK